MILTIGLLVHFLINLLFIMEIFLKLILILSQNFDLFYLKFKKKNILRGKEKRIDAVFLRFNILIIIRFVCLKFIHLFNNSIKIKTLFPRHLTINQIPFVYSFVSACFLYFCICKCIMHRSL